MPKAVVVADEIRARGARYAVNNLHAQAIVLDDGFQHRGLHRDLDIVLIDASRSPFTTPMLPAGYRREPLNSLKRADAVLLTKVRAVTNVDRLKEDVRSYSSAKIFTSSFNVVAFRRAKTKFSVDLSSIRGKHAVAFCGIGRPESFRESLEDAGVQVRSLIPFEDHHQYSDADMRRIAREHEKTGAEYIVTTEKDIARLSTTDFIERFPLFYLEMETKINERQAWDEMISSACIGKTST